MLNAEPNSEEIVIVGCCTCVFGELADDHIYITPVPSDCFDHAVGAFNHKLKMIGYVWARQALAMSKWMSAHQLEYVEARIKKEERDPMRMWKAETAIPIHLPKEEVTSNIDINWAGHLPIMSSLMPDPSVNLSLMLLRDELMGATEWKDCMNDWVDNLLKALSVDLSAKLSKACFDVYLMMINSKIEAIRAHGYLLFRELLYHESETHLNWWLEQWWPTFLSKVAASDLVAAYESKYSLEQIENLLNDAPAYLFHTYKNKHALFAVHLYFASLPQTVYHRLLTLLAVREAMLAKRSLPKTVKPQASDEYELQNLSFFTDPCFKTVEGQRKLTELLMSILPKIDADLGRDWIGLYIAYHFFKDKLVMMKRYANLFKDIETLLVRHLSKIDVCEKGYKRYKNYIDSLSSECDKWFVDGGCLPPMNQWRSRLFHYQVDKDRLERIQKLVTVIYQGLKAISQL